MKPWTAFRSLDKSVTRSFADIIACSRSGSFGRVPTESLEAWARALGVEPSAFARELLSHYEPELHRLLFKESKARK